MLYYGLSDKLSFNENERLIIENSPPAIQCECTVRAWGKGEYACVCVSACVGEKE